MIDRSTEEYQNKMLKVYSDPDRNRRIGESRKGTPGASSGKKWYNDRLNEKYFTEGEQPAGWINGRLNKK
jgi:hypothetical protein